MNRFAIVVLVTTVALGTPVAAHDHRIPSSSLRIDDGVQKGRLVASTWVRGTSDGSGECVASFADGYGWPRRAVRYPPETETGVVRLHKAAPPMEVELAAGFGEDPAGGPTTLVSWPFVLRPRPPTEPRSWELVFPVPRGEHLFLELEASWRDEDGCTGAGDLGDQYGLWRFHAAPRRAPGCTRGRVEALVRRFVRAYNRGDSVALERSWAQEPDFEWYFVEDERESPDAMNRSTLGSYFSERHLLGDRLHLRRLGVGPPNEAGHFGVGFRLRRSSNDPSAEGMWHGKASATTVNSFPDLPYAGTRPTCALAVWSMGRG